MTGSLGGATCWTPPSDYRAGVMIAATRERPTLADDNVIGGRGHGDENASEGSDVSTSSTAEQPGRRLDITSHGFATAGGGRLTPLLDALTKYEGALLKPGETAVALVSLLAEVRRCAREGTHTELPAATSLLVEELVRQVDRETRRIRLTPTPSVGAKGAKDIERQRLVDHIPSTTMGKFDAVYDPGAGQLKIILRVHFAFEDEAKEDVHGMQPAIWGQTGKTDSWREEFCRVVGGTWSGRFRFRCASPDWALPSVDVAVRVEPVDDPKSAHHQVHARRQSEDQQLYRGENRPEALWDPTAARVVMLDEHDVEAVPHTGAARAVRDVITKDVKPRIEKLAGGKDGSLIVRFSNEGRLEQIDGLRGLVQILYPWPTDRLALELTGFHLPVGAVGSQESGGVSAEEAAKRCQLVSGWLSTNGVGHHISVSYSPTVKVVSDRSFTLGEQGSVRVGVAMRPGFKPQSPYSTAAHEMGHALGNVDFYRDDMVRAVGLESNDETRVQIGLGRAQTRFFELVDAAHMTDQSPAIGVVTDTIMSMGERVLPIHYLPFWEALTRITEGKVFAEDWIIT